MSLLWVGNVDVDVNVNVTVDPVPVPDLDDVIATYSLVNTISTLNFREAERISSS